MVVFFPLHVSDAHCVCVCACLVWCVCCVCVYACVCVCVCVFFHLFMCSLLFLLCFIFVLVPFVIIHVVIIIVIISTIAIKTNMMTFGPVTQREMKQSEETRSQLEDTVQRLQFDGKAKEQILSDTREILRSEPVLLSLQLLASCLPLKML